MLVTLVVSCGFEMRSNEVDECMVVFVYYFMRGEVGREIMLLGFRCWVSVFVLLILEREFW